MQLDSDPGGPFLPQPPSRPSRPSAKTRAVVTGPVWSADLAETMLEVYGGLIQAGWTLEDLSRMVLETSDDRSGD